LVKPYGFTSHQTTGIIHLLQSESGKYIQSPTHSIIRNRKWLIISPNETSVASNILIEEENKMIEFNGGKSKLRIETFAPKSPKGDLSNLQLSTFNLQPATFNFFIVLCLPMKLLSPAISHLARFRLWRIQNWVTDPVAAQREVLQDLVTAAQYTEFGRKYGFSKLFSIRDFKKSIPIHEYNDIKPYILRMMEGEENILWNTPVRWFAKSSGTTSEKSKFIPVSDESLSDTHFKASKDVLTNYYKNFPESDLLTGKSLVVGGSHQVNQVNDSVQYGDLSAVLMQNTPFWGHWIRTPELSIALLDEWENKIERLAISTIEENVTSLAGVPTWTIVLIKRILALSGEEYLKDVWPNLELYIHGGVSFTPYREQLNKLIGKKIN
jgi:hypothetical protein